ncbi:HAD hydrolase-like protein [Bifidobacterium simiarum]|uniref:HAD hydrolase-like protein n=1 Tax=Bifidobacterium simiarum TaxID=2045441 RepID=UPI001BDD4141|nr:HAD hydrolase-like protein [Bifidobacterium simiarum]MBT1166289.1 HAD hydrolase-like protein [Bifidobacterium simiarum]
MAQHPRKVVLLDLDGTLTKSDPGIIASVTMAFKELGHPVPDDEELHRFIGPAIQESMERNGLHGKELEEGIRIYRRYYSDIDYFDDPNHPGNKVPGRLYNTVYPGIPEQMRKLTEAGYFLAVATCKPEPQAKVVCEHFGITDMVNGVWGASMDDSRLHKDEVIRYCFDEIGYDEARGDRAVMVGDRWTDMDGGKAVGIGTIGCRWGYAEAGELEAHGATLIIDTVDQLLDGVNRYFAGV